MADIRWTGGATAVAQVDTFTPANVEIDDIFTLTITGWDGTSHAISFTATAATVANVTAGIEAAWNASTNTLCTPITATDNTTTVSLTADVAGVAFSVASTAVDGGGTDTQTFTKASTTASAGPKHWDSADNWDTGVVPGGASGQDVYVENADDEIVYGLDQSGITTLDSLNIARTFTGKIGLNGASGYSGTYLQIKATAVNIGYHYTGGSPAGSGRIMIDTGSTASTITVEGSATASDTNRNAIRVKANSASTNIKVLKGDVGVAVDAGETTTIGTVSMSYDTSKDTDSQVTLGGGVTMTTLNKNAGICYLGCAVTTVNNELGNLNTFGEGAITTINIEGGKLTSNSSGTITTLNILAGTADFTKSLADRTVTTLKIDSGGTLEYDPAVLTITNDIEAYDTNGNLRITGSTP
jgi:hypothetical protein